MAIRFGAGLALLLCLPLLALAEPFDRIVLIVGSKVITQNEIEVRLFEEARQSGQDYVAFAQNPTNRTQAQEVLVQEALLDGRAERMNLAVSQDEVEDEVERIRTGQKMTPSQFEEFLEQQHFSMVDLKKSIRRRLARERILAIEVRSKVKVDEQELRANYLKGNQELKAHVRHILKALPPNATPAEEQKAQKALQEISAKLAQGQDFGELAKAFSDDPSAKSNGGDLGWVGQKGFLPSFTQVVFSLEPGAISSPSRTKFGLHLIQVVEKKMVDEKPQAPFEQVKNQLQQKAYQEMYQQVLQEYMDHLKQETLIRRPGEEDPAQAQAEASAPATKPQATGLNHNPKARRRP